MHKFRVVAVIAAWGALATVAFAQMPATKIGDSVRP